jgi:hypothetical protein
MESIIVEKMNQYSSKLVKDLEKMMEDRAKKASINMEKKDLELLRKISENNTEFKELKENYFHPERVA